MAQFRTTADILDEILLRAGETSSGTSPFETYALGFANKAHHAIVGGGSIFSLQVDEAWTWARARYPFTITLLPAYETGTITFTQNDTSITFSNASSTSLEGWFLQATNKQTVYRITQHTASSTAATIDSPFVDTGGAYAFRAFKLEYDLVPEYIYIDSNNDKVDFSEVAGTQITATLTHGSYTPSLLAAHVATKLTSAGTVTYSGSYDSVLRTITLTSPLTGGKIFTLLGATGTNRRRSALPSLGFDRLDLAAASADSTGAYVGKYVVNGINRLIEPFRVYNGLNAEPHIMSTDAYHMEQESPLALTREGVPCKFAKVSEASDGTYVVRFDSYPASRTKVLIDWIPVPIDLQDNASSIPLIPRKDVDVLINAAAMYIAFEKSDDKLATLTAMTKAQLLAMEKKNRAELFRTGDNFGQIIPRADLSNLRKKLNYGYTATGATGTASEVPQTMISVTLDYSQFATAATVATVTARTLPANRTLFALIAKHSIAFSGTGVTAANIDVGISGDTDRFISAFNVYQAVADTAQDSSYTVYYPGTATPITVRLFSSGGNLNALTAGSVTLYFSEQVVP